jgi:hypothetical protein
MSYLEKIKKLSTYSHLPNFAILSKNKLYLPNSDNQYTILGKWSLDWIHSNRCAIGTVEQDDYHNITFQITSCYECTDEESTFTLVPKSIFTQYWKRVYQHEPLLTYIHINISEFYQSSPIVSPLRSPLVADLPLKVACPKQDLPLRSPLVADLPKSSKSPIEVSSNSITNVRRLYDSPKHKEIIQNPNVTIDKVKNTISSTIQVLEKPETPKPKEKTIDLPNSSEKFQVCKTDKPDVYHVYQSNKYVSTCLIPNMKTSRYMQDLFENKQISEMITMNMKLHVNTNKYYPII